MFNLARSTLSRSARMFSTSPPNQVNVAKLTLVGFLAKEPETRVTKNDKEYVAYTVATTNYPPPPASDGARAPATFHRILSFNPSANAWLPKVTKGSLVYVEAGYEVREPNPDAEAGSYAASRQILLRHEHLRVIRSPKSAPSETE